MKRYAVQFPDGTFSSGPRREPVAIEKAKLWKTRGQVTQHLDQARQGTYTAGCKVVEVEIVATVVPLIDVAEYVAGRNAERNRRQRESEAQWAETRLRLAEEELRRARAALGKP